LLRRWGWDGEDVETIVGIGMGMGIRVVLTVGDGYKYLSPCSSLMCGMRGIKKIPRYIVNRYWRSIHFPSSTYSVSCTFVRLREMYKILTGKKMLTVSSSFSKLVIVMIWEAIVWSYLPTEADSTVKSNSSVRDRLWMESAFPGGCRRCVC